MLRPIPLSAPVGIFLIALSIGLSCLDHMGNARPAQNLTENGAAPVLRISVLEGEDGVNILKSKMAVKPVIEVRDRNNLPVSGASVTFIAPQSGPRVAFAHGANTFTTTTDANGRALVSNLKPLGKGTFKIGIKVVSQGQTVTSTVAQTNFLTATTATAAGATVGTATVSTAASAGISAVAVGGIVAGGAAALGGIIAATRGSKPTVTKTSVSASVGSHHLRIHPSIRFKPADF
jgi:hypothetical protein